MMTEFTRRRAKYDALSESERIEELRALAHSGSVQNPSGARFYMWNRIIRAIERELESVPE